MSQGSFGIHGLAVLLAAAGLVAASLGPSLAQPSSSDSMLASVKSRGSVRCGVNPGLAGVVSQFEIQAAAVRVRTE